MAANQSVQRPLLPHPSSCATVTASAPELPVTLTVILPCYNEAERMPGTLRVLLAHLSCVPGTVEILVVDDGSTDDTGPVVEAIAGPMVVSGCSVVSPTVVAFSRPSAAVATADHLPVWGWAARGFQHRRDDDFRASAGVDLRLTGSKVRVAAYGPAA